MSTSKLGWASLGQSFACECGVTHALPIEACHVGLDAARRLAALARERCGPQALVVSDENTRAIGGEKLLRAMSDAGKHIREKVYGSAPFEASMDLAEEVAQAGQASDFFVGIGSGTVCDLAKYAGDKLHKPVLLFGTAASMNGYTSGIVALNVRGLKRTLPCTPALGVFADPEVVATAPREMSAAGVGDFLSKCASSSDWYAAHFLRGGYYCPRPQEFFEGTVERVLAASDGVGRGDAGAIAVVMEALLLAGLSMLAAGSSAPASGGEHLLSHYLDMRHAVAGTPNDLHGAQVGVATIHCLGLWEKILALPPDSLDIDKLVEASPSEDEVEQQIRADWGPIAPEVLAQWRTKALDQGGLREELTRFQRGFGELREAVSGELLPAAEVERAIRAAGGPATPADLAAHLEEFENALRGARFIRDRFTVLDLAAELGLS